MRSYFTFSRADSANNFLRFAKMIGVKRPGKCASTSHSYIFVMDEVKVNESIAKYVHTDFEAI